MITTSSNTYTGTTSTPISSIRRHYLVVGTKTALKQFCHLPSQCTGISPSDEWSELHQSWADRSARGVFQYTLSTGGGHVSVTCADFSCVAPNSGNTFVHGDSIQALIRPLSLTRSSPQQHNRNHSQQNQQQQAAMMINNHNNDGNQNQNNNIDSVNNIHQNSFQNTNTNLSSNTTNVSSNQNDSDQENNNNNQQGFTRTMPSKSATKHSHFNAYVVSTIFVLVEMYDAQTLNMASASLKLLDDQCKLLNPHQGNVPQIVFVALNMEQENKNQTILPSCTFFPEVLIDDVIELSRRLNVAKGRVDEVTLVM